MFWSSITWRKTSRYPSTRVQRVWEPFTPESTTRRFRFSCAYRTTVAICTDWTWIACRTLWLCEVSSLYLWPYCCHGKWPLTAISDSKKPLYQTTSRLQCMLMKLQCYDVYLTYVPGKEMYNIHIRRVKPSVSQGVIRNAYRWRLKSGLYSELIGSKNDNIQVIPSEIQEFPSPNWSKYTSSSSKFTSNVLHWWRKTPWQY